MQRSALDILREEYPGDDAWKQFVEFFPSETTPALTQEIIDTEIATVLFAKLGNHASAWWKKQLPALEGKTPHEVFSSVDHGVMMLKSLLMRLPD